MININLAIIGAGRMGKLHANNFNHIHSSNVKAIVDTEEELGIELANEVDAEYYNDIQNVFDDESIDAIVIATPILTHKDFIIEGIKAGKHVFCEKPLTLTMENANEIKNVIESHNKKFQLAFMRRFDEDFLFAKNKIEKGAIGTPVFIRSTGRDPGLPPVPGWGAEPEKCGDISFELCSHDYDSMRWMFDDEVTEVYAKSDILSSHKEAELTGGKMISDTLVISLQFSRGALGSVDGLLNIKYGYDARMEIVGDQGVLLIGTPNYNNVVLGTNNKVLESISSPSFIDRFKNAYVKEAEHFIHCILNDEEPKVGINDGLEAVRIAYKVNESIDINKPVQLRR